MSEERTEDAEAQTKGKGRRRLILLGLAAFFVLCGAGYGAYWKLVGQFYEDTDDAYVHGDLVPVMPQVSGTAVAVLVDNTQLVQEGQPLVKLDKTDARVTLAQAEANLAKTVRHVQQLYETEKQLKAKVQMERSQLAQSRLDYQHYSHLTERGFYPRENTRHTQTQVDINQAGLASAEHELAATRAMIADTSIASHPDVKLAAARLRKAYISLKRTTLVAPATGYVAKNSAEIGQQITPGTPLMSIVPLDRIWVVANFKESQLSNVRLDQPVDLSSDFYGAKVTYHGRIQGLAPGTGSAFALLPPQNATGNWIKVVQRVPVRIRLAPKEIKAHPLRIGLSMKATIDTHDRKGEMLAKAPHPVLDYATRVYQ
ncbi:MAG TPA: efflux RND transporter periplasmic adaptor subunit, partial [Gammaproteobacteria bacterium]|nr:efflux RND transporter periplasmic adaptor subunit [Gammaproteobacteria bacterium]